MCRCNKKKSVPETVPPVRAVVVQKAVIQKPVLTTAQWGPPTWMILHTLAELTGDNKDHDALWRGLLINLRGRLPCEECRKHYSAWWAQTPLVSGGVRGWLLALHNDVNRRRRVSQWTENAIRATYGGERTLRMAAVREALEKLRSLGLVDLADGFRYVIEVV